jgi:hypothetical protein
MVVVDLDQDGDQDVVACSTSTVLWCVTAFTQPCSVSQVGL